MAFVVQVPVRLDRLAPRELDGAAAVRVGDDVVPITLVYVLYGLVYYEYT